MLPKKRLLKTAKLLSILFLLFAVPAFAGPFTWDSGYKTDVPDAEDTDVSTTDFDGNLSASDTNVQAALDTLDDLSVPTLEYNDLSDICTNIADTQIAIGTAADTAAYASLSGDVTMANDGTVTISGNSVALGTDTTGNYAAGNAEAGDALTGDTATAFFDAGTIEHERGGLEADVNAYDGLIGITGGATYNQTGTDAQIIIFDGAGAPTSAALSSDVTMTNAGVVSISADAVALTTDTTGDYVASITDGDNGIDGGNGGSEAAALTLSFDGTEIDAITWSDNANASNVWTFDVSGTDHTMTAGDGVMTFSHAVTATGDVTGQNFVTAGNVDGVDVSAHAALNIHDSVADTTDTSSYVALFESATGDLAPKTDAGITYNAGTGTLTATGFSGPLTGNASTATLASTVTVSDDESTDDAHEIVFTTDNATLESDGTMTYNPSTGVITTTGFAGNLTGAVTGNASTASALAANGANCNAGEIPLGVDASGAVEGCYEPSTGDITGINAGTDITADLEEESHASEHAVSAADTVFPADPDADKYLQWDDDPGQLAWADAPALDTTAVDSTTWSDGANAANTWTFDVSGTDTTLVIGNGIATYSGNFAIGSDPADTGALRLDNGAVIAWEDGTETTLTHVDNTGLSLNTNFTAATMNSTGNLTVNADVLSPNSLTLYTTGAGDNIVIDANSGGAADIALGVNGDSDTIHIYGAVTADGSITADSIVANLYDASGAVDLDIGSADVTDITLVEDGGTYIFDNGLTAAGEDLGSATAEWNDLYLNDGGIIQMGNDQDVTITHVADTGILLALDRQIQFNDSGTFIESDDDGYLDLDADTGIRLNGTLAADLQMGEIDIKLDATLSGDATWSGITTSGTLGDTIAVGDLVYLNNDDSRWELVDANLSDGYDKQLGIAVTAGNDGDSADILVYGKVRSAVFPAFTVGSPLYMSETAGDVTHTQPSTASVCIRVVGFALTAEDLMFNPSNDYITHA